MPGPLSYLLVPLVLVSFENRVEARAHAFGQEQMRFDLLESPRVELSAMGQRDTVSLSYAPTLLLLSVGRPESELAMFHTLDGRLTHTYRHGFVSLGQSVTAGRNNLRLTLAPTRPPEPAATPPGGPTAQPPGGPAAQGPLFDEVAWFGNTTTIVTFGQIVTQRLNTYEYASYSVHGGLDADARELYPPQQQQASGAGVSYVASPRDTVTSGFDAQRTSTAGLGEVYMLTARERWDRAFTRSTGGGLTVGATYAAERTEDGRDMRRWLPLAEVGVTTRWAGDSAESLLEASLGVAPAVDWLSGRLDHRLYGGATFSQTRQAYRWFTSLNAVTSVDPDSEGALTAVALLGGITRPLTRELALDAVVSTSWQLFQGQETAPLLWMGVVGLTYRPLPTRL